MKKLLSLAVLLLSLPAFAQTGGDTQKDVLFVVSSATRMNNGWDTGFWLAELTHAYHELTEAGFTADIASPLGGTPSIDPWSDPRNPYGLSTHDMVSMGFLHMQGPMSKLNSSLRLSEVELSKYEVIVFAGGNAAMFDLPTDPSVQQAVRTMWEQDKVVAALCHGTSALLNVRLSNGSYLLRGRTVTGFSNAEERQVEQMLGVTGLMPFWIENEVPLRGGTFISAAPWAPFATRDGRLVTGQQQYSGRAVAHLILKTLSR
ncbi:MAG TPA: type 1 glutamine amidotransferase domain-containing protein [Archangium sp.]|uniref:type 1 glutamine amidotransferase domain-containing protein n=1 Tax=Archangium sp. TaxID=1872627 RepID=UPI002E3557EC|nr:type 1 glutamine amidotransferase domain-containing protein [Archangium sp.]HEX5749311.1 type 1 glutamine amidotransferase domain-containing protein [Archangium sp.]